MSSNLRTAAAHAFAATADHLRSGQPLPPYLIALLAQVAAAALLEAQG